jgi:hypothetical protein
VLAGRGLSRVVLAYGSGQRSGAPGGASIVISQTIQLGRPSANGAAALARVRSAALRQGGVWTTSGTGIRVTGVRISNRNVSGAVSKSSIHRRGSRQRGAFAALPATRRSEFR